MMMGSVYAEETTPNQITSGTNHTWTGVNTGALPACCSGGPGALYDPNTNTIHFSYGQSIATQTFAVNQALQNAGSGIVVTGYNYSWDINNNNYDNRQGGTDTLTARVITFTPTGTVRRDDRWTYNTRFDWTTFSGSINYITPGAPSEFGNLRVEFIGSDGGFWAGYFGPQVRNVDVSLNYAAQTIDPCTQDPLSSPSCPGYQQAYHDQQCSANPLYATTCPGYQQAYYNQQCSINPLYDSGCPGYQQAYYNQQCSLNPLYDNQCPGYAQAYFDQQCSADPLYDNQCSGYQQAYFDQQCSLNGLYDRTCPNYAQAYATQQLLNQQNSPTTIVTTTSEPVVEISDDGKVSTDVPLVSDPVVNQVLTKKPETKKEESKEEKKDVAVAEKPKAKSTRQAAPAKVDPATQTQSEKEFEQTVASQAAAVNAISFVPGFSAYQNAIIPDTNALTMQRQYNKPTVDNARAQRQLSGASDRLHNEMVQQQYR
jgi:hypothetical protein